MPEKIDISYFSSFDSDLFYPLGGCLEHRRRRLRPLRRPPMWDDEFLKKPVMVGEWDVKMAGLPRFSTAKLIYR